MDEMKVNILLLDIKGDVRNTILLKICVWEGGGIHAMEETKMGKVRERDAQ